MTRRRPSSLALPQSKRLDLWRTSMHQAGFMTHRSYFQTIGAGGTGTAAGFGTLGGRPAGGRR